MMTAQEATTAAERSERKRYWAQRRRDGCERTFEDRLLHDYDSAQCELRRLRGIERLARELLRPAETLRMALESTS